MHDKPNESNPERGHAPGHPLRSLSALEFARLGGSDIAFVRPVTRDELETMLPDVALPEPSDELHLVMSAEGRPLLIADTREAVGEWLAGNDVQLVARH
jgi:hypothetical protein